MSQKGFTPLVFILGILIASGLIIGGAFVIKSVSYKNPPSQNPLLEKVNIPNNSAEPKASPNLVKQENISQNLPIFDSPCISFKYPKEWQKGSEKVENEHRVNTKGIDTYGATTVTFRKLDKSTPAAEQSFNLIISCTPNKLVKVTTFAEILKSDTEEFERHASDNIPEDKVEQVSISGVSFDKIITNAYSNKNGGSRIGTITMNGLSDSYYFLINLSWPYSLGNDPNIETRRDFEAIVQSINIKK